MSRKGWLHGDEELLAELRDAVRARRSVPASYADAARAAFTWRSIDAELALLALSYDSALSEPEPVRAADAGSARVLAFESAELTVHLEILPEAVAGQLVPARAGWVTLETARGVAARAPIGDDGFFRLARPAADRVRLVLAGRPTLATAWLRL